MVDLKSGALLVEWLDRVLGNSVPRNTRGVAHGGTLLTLRGIKESTKDVDIAFLQRDAFDATQKALLANEYALSHDLQALPGESFLRFRNPQESIDVVDLRYPTWNSWAMKGTALAGCDRDLHGNFELLLPDVATTFAFKIYPCRASDLSDLRDILTRSPPLWDRVWRVLDEQERYAWDSVDYSGALLVGQVRGRAYASSAALLAAGTRDVRPFHDAARERWMRLGLPVEDPDELLRLIRSIGPWQRFLSENEDRIASSLR